MFARCRIVCLPYLDGKALAWASSGRYKDALNGEAIPLAPRMASANLDLRKVLPLFAPIDDSANEMSRCILKVLTSQPKAPAPTSMNDVLIFLRHQIPHNRRAVSWFLLALAVFASYFHTNQELSLAELVAAEAKYLFRRCLRII